MIHPVRNKPPQAAAAVRLNGGRISNGIKFFDAHTHVQFAAYDSDRNEVIKKALEAGVGMVNVGTEKNTSKAAVDLAHRHDHVWATVGIHPTHASGSDYHDKKELSVALPREGELFDYEYYKKLAADPKVIAIGECGLDYYRVKSNEQEVMRKQKDVFIEQIRLAHEVKKPLMIHCRETFPDLIDILITHNSLLNTPPGIIHFFSGAEDDAKKLLDLGFSFTFGGVITFTRDYDEVIKMIPIDRILSETDAPYVAPAPYRGKRNEPVYVIEVVKKLEEIKGVSLEKTAEQILENARLIFNISI